MSWARCAASRSFGGGDDGALHQDVPRPGDAVGVAQAGGFGALAHDRADVVQVLDARPVGHPSPSARCERATIEVLTLSEPVMEHVEDAAAALWGVAAQPRLLLD